MSKNGGFRYATNRGQDSVRLVAVDLRSGKLNLIRNVPSRGPVARKIAIVPADTHLLAVNRSSTNIGVLGRDAKPDD